MIGNVTEVTGGKGGEAYLVTGLEKSALIDCGMAYCAPQLIANIKKVLGGRKLDYIFLGHSHYDHVGALPYLKEEWPDVKAMGAQHASDVLQRPNALKKIRQLSAMAGSDFGSEEAVVYDDSLMKVDVVVHENDTFDLGGSSVMVIETPGHTKCSLTFIANGDVMFASETCGVMTKEGRVYPAFVNSYQEALLSIEKCSRIKPKIIISPHTGLVNDRDVPAYWQKCRAAAEECRGFVLRLLSKGYDEDRVFEQYRKAYRNEAASELQPNFAFEINSRAMIRTIICGK
jgi:glyoxylase-like metal-dependent hydrolase (beta-lactamase superfamily II)